MGPVVAWGVRLRVTLVIIIVTTCDQVKGTSTILPVRTRYGTHTVFVLDLEIRHPNFGGIRRIGLTVNSESGIVICWIVNQIRVFIVAVQLQFSTIGTVDTNDFYGPHIIDRNLLFSSDMDLNGINVTFNPRNRNNGDGVNHGICLCCMKGKVEIRTTVSRLAGNSALGGRAWNEVYVRSSRNVRE